MSHAYCLTTHRRGVKPRRKDKDMTIALLACHFADSIKYEVYHGNGMDMMMVEHGKISDIIRPLMGKEFHTVTVVEHWHMSDDNTLRMWI